MHRLGFVALTITVAALLASCNMQPEAEVAAFGDSVTWGYGDLPGGWVRHLEQQSGYKISNLGVPGEKTDAGADRVDVAIRTVPKASVVFILHGGNDWVSAFQNSECHRSCEPSEIDSKYTTIGGHLRTIRQVIAHHGKRPVFLTYWPDNGGKCPVYPADTFARYQRHRERLNVEITKVAAEHGDLVIHLDDLADFGIAGNFFDCLHPSAQGYEKIAKRLLADVDKWAPPEPQPKDMLQAHW